MISETQRWRRRALAAALAVGYAGQAAAVSVNPSGLGQVLLFPYYSARSVGGTANTTFVSLSNGTSTAKVLGVSFFEGKAGKQVLGFNVFLAPNQTWTAAIGASSSGGAEIYTTSIACSAPGFAPPPPSNVTAPPPDGLTPGVPVGFRNYAYAGDGIGDGLERTLEGHIEVIEEATYASNSQTAIAVTPVNGVATCAITNANATAEAQPPLGRLMGYAEVVNVLQGLTFAAEPTALDSFSTVGAYVLPGSIKPDLNDVFPPIATWTSGTQTISASGFVQPVDAVSAVLMHDSVLNHFYTNTAASGATDWVLTFPTKPYYFSGSGAVYLFQRDLTPQGACDDINLFLPGIVAAPPLPGVPAAQLSICWSTSVISFNGSNSQNLLGSGNAKSLGIPAVATDTWASLTFSQTSVPANVHALTSAAAIVSTPPATQSTSVPGVRFAGLPVIGFAARRLKNGFIANAGTLVRSTEPSTTPHRFVDSVSP